MDISNWLYLKKNFEINFKKASKSLGTTTITKIRKPQQRTISPEAQKMLKRQRLRQRCASDGAAGRERVCVREAKDR